MEKEFICGGEKYEVYGDNLGIGLVVNLGGLPEKVKVRDTNFYLPAPYHVTLFYLERYTKIYEIQTLNFKSEIIKDFCEFVKTNEIKFLKYKNEYRIVQRSDRPDKEPKVSIIVMCEVANLNNFFDLVNEKYGLNIKYPVPHVTLYNTLKGEPGWYLLDIEDLKTYTTFIENPIDRML